MDISNRITHIDINHNFRNAVGWLLIAAALLLSACAGVQLEPLAGLRIVSAYKGTGDEINIRMSNDGIVWTEASPVKEGTAILRTQSPPTIIFHEGLYHLYWHAPNNAIRYASSRDARHWIVQNSPLTTLANNTDPVFARGNNKHVAVYRSSQGIISIDLDNISNRATLAIAARGKPSIVFGNGIFLLSTINQSGVLAVHSSSDGIHWSPLHQFTLSNVFQAELTFSNNQFRITSKRSTGGGTIPGNRCDAFSSSDGNQWATLQIPSCGNINTELASLSFRNHNLALMNVENRVLEVADNNTTLLETHFYNPIGGISYAIGPGPQLAAMRLDSARVSLGSGQDLTIVALGYHVRIGEPGSARVTYSGQLREFATDIDSGTTVTVPPLVSPFAWITDYPEDPTAEDGKFDIMGAIHIGIERGDCPDGPIRDEVEHARASIETAMNRHLATASTAALIDEQTRDATVALVTCEVEQTLRGGNPAVCSAPPPSGNGDGISLGEIFVGTFEGFGNWVADGIGSTIRSLACGFNEDEQFEPTNIMFVNWGLFPEGPSPRKEYKIDTGIPLRPLDAYSLRSSDNSQSWSVSSTLQYNGAP